MWAIKHVLNSKDLTDLFRRFWQLEESKNLISSKENNSQSIFEADKLVMMIRSLAVINNSLNI